MNFPENINRWTVILALVSVLFVGTLGWFFGDMNGYARGQRDCAVQPVQNLALEHP